MCRGNDFSTRVRQKSTAATYFHLLFLPSSTGVKSQSFLDSSHPFKERDGERAKDKERESEKALPMLRQKEGSYAFHLGSLQARDENSHSDGQRRASDPLRALYNLHQWGRTMHRECQRALKGIANEKQSGSGKSHKAMWSGGLALK